MVGEDVGSECGERCVPLLGIDINEARSTYRSGFRTL